MTINRRTAGEPIDLGFLAECLVFYRRVTVITDKETFKFLVRACGPEVLLELMDMDVLEIVYFENLSGVVSIPLSDGTVAHDYGNIASNEIRYQQVSRALFDELSGPSGRGANRLYNQFERRVRREEYGAEINKEIVQQDFADENYLTDATRSLLSYLVPSVGLPESLIFKPTFVPRFGYRIQTNIDFGAVNSEYHKKVPPSHSSIDIGYILSHIGATRRDVKVASIANSDISLSPEGSIIASCKFAEIVRAADSSIKSIDLFQEQLIEDLPDIAEAINSGRRSFPEILPVIHAAQKFKDWLQNLDDQNAVISEYAREVTKSGWADRVPTRAIRCIVMWGLGLATVPLNPFAGAALTLGLGSADTFLLDKLIKGWKPNQFVDGPLKKFLKF